MSYKFFLAIKHYTQHTPIPRTQNFLLKSNKSLIYFSAYSEINRAISRANVDWTSKRKWKLNIKNYSTLCRRPSHLFIFSSSAWWTSHCKEQWWRKGQKGREKNGTCYVIFLTFFMYVCFSFCFALPVHWTRFVCLLVCLGVFRSIQCPYDGVVSWMSVCVFLYCLQAHLYVRLFVYLFALVVYVCLYVCLSVNLRGIFLSVHRCNGWSSLFSRMSAVHPYVNLSVDLLVYCKKSSSSYPFLLQHLCCLLILKNSVRFLKNCFAFGGFR